MFLIDLVGFVVQVKDIAITKHEGTSKRYTMNLSINHTIKYNKKIITNV